MQELERENCSLEVALDQGRRVRADEAVPLALGRTVEDWAVEFAGAAAALCCAFFRAPLASRRPLCSAPRCLLSVVTRTTHHNSSTRRSATAPVRGTPPDRLSGLLSATGVQGSKRWLQLVAAAKERDAADLSTFEGYRTVIAGSEARTRPTEHTGARFCRRREHAPLAIALPLCPRTNS